MKTAANRLLTLALLFGLGVTASYGGAPTPRKSAGVPKPELADVAVAAVQRGFHAELPPHISNLLGLTHEEKCPVLQGVLRTGDKIQGIEVRENNHNDIVIFTVDEATNDQIYFLTSPSGALRRVLSVQQGVGNVVRPGKADVEAFQKEKKMWEERLARRSPAS